ncbi:MAG: hypothetical protein ACI35R_17415 [Bacillus sp. (in: firmicutes)]
MTRVGGPIPDSYGLSLTVKCPTASEANPINTGDLLSWDGTTAYGVIKTPSGQVPDARAKHNVVDPYTPLGAHVFNASRVEVFTYSGAAPAIGASVVSDGKGGVMAMGAPAEGAPTGNGTRVLFVDTAKKVVEVLLP